jgi:hypothetical protein
LIDLGQWLAAGGIPPWPANVRPFRQSFVIFAIVSAVRRWRRRAQLIVRDVAAPE